MKLKSYLNEKIGKWIWLDDVRKPNHGFILFKSVPPLKEYYKKNWRDITKMSLDHDLGENTPTGYDFLVWIEEMVYTGEFDSFPETVRVHSANPIGKKRMEQTIKSIRRRL